MYISEKILVIWRGWYLPKCVWLNENDWGRSKMTSECQMKNEVWSYKGFCLMYVFHFWALYVVYYVVHSRYFTSFGNHKEIFVRKGLWTLYRLVKWVIWTLYRLVIRVTYEPYMEWSNKLYMNPIGCFSPKNMQTPFPQKYAWKMRNVLKLKMWWKNHITSYRGFQLVESERSKKMRKKIKFY